MRNIALLIIDMQKVSFTPQTPRFDADGLVERINKLSKSFRETGAPVIIIQHDGTKEGGCIPGSSEWELLPGLEVMPSDKLIGKSANDCFYRSDLQRQLQKFGVNELVITGCATDFCVEATIQSALVKEFKVIVVKDGHTTGDRPHLKAEQVIEHYNWVWQNMIPINGSMQVVGAQELMEKLKIAT